MGNKGWSILFGITMLGCAMGFVISPFMGWSMPEGVSSHANDVDLLYYVIFWITTFFFFLTEGLLVVFLWKYASTGSKPPVSAAAEHPGYLKPLTNVLHDQHRVEMAWTLVPAVILLYIAFAQVNTWADIKYATRNQRNDWTYADDDKEKKNTRPTQQIAVSARQFEWRMRYPSVERFDKWRKDSKDSKETKLDYDSFGKVPQPDDIHVVNELHIWKDQPVVVHLSTRDVIHSFNLPNFRVKQDALPGKLIPVWFRPIKANTALNKDGRYVDGVQFADEKDPDPEKYTANPDYIWDIPCAELCGWGHYRMIGRVYVHPNEKEFRKWLEKAEANNRSRTGS